MPRSQGGHTVGLYSTTVCPPPAGGRCVYSVCIVPTGMRRYPPQAGCLRRFAVVIGGSCVPQRSVHTIRPLGPSASTGFGAAPERGL